MGLCMYNLGNVPKEPPRDIEKEEPTKTENNEEIEVEEKDTDD